MENNLSANAKPLRILLLDTGKEWGGGTNSMLELLKRLDRQRFEVTACFYKNYQRGSSTLAQELAAIGIPLLLLATRPQPLWAKLMKELLRGLLAWNRDWRNAAIFHMERLWRIHPRARALATLLHSGGYNLLYLNNQPASNLEGYLASEISGVPVIQHCRIEPRLNAFERAKVNQVARAIVCVSRGVAAALAREGVRVDLCHIVHNGIDTHQPLPTPHPFPAAAGTQVIGTIGSLIKRKSVDHLLRAVAALPGGLAPHVLIVGEGPEEEALRLLANDLGIATRLTFAGFQREPLPWLAAMDVFVLTSPSEGLPRVILEAMLLAKPVIASDVTGTNEVVVPGATGYLYPYGNLATLSEHLAAVLRNPEKAKGLGEAGLLRVGAEFSIERYVDGVVHLLETI